MSMSADGTRWRKAFITAGPRIEEAVAQHKFIILALFSFLYLIATGYRASRKAFWFDEIFTVYISRLQDIHDIWSALKHGVDFNPPMFYLLTKTGEKLVGSGHLGARLPEIVGFGILCLCLFRFVSFRTTVLAGLVAMIFPVAASAYWYAYEARPHGIVAGCCGLALVCWQGATTDEVKTRVWWLIGLGSALSGAVFNHAYGTLIFIPLLIGELTRSINRRRIDLPVCLTLLLASIACVALVPLAQVASLPEIGGNHGDVSFTSVDRALVRVSDSYKWHLEKTSLALTLAVIFIFTHQSLSSRAFPRIVSPYPDPPSHEIVALWILVGLPVFAAILSMLTKSPFLDRYSISLVGGVAGLLGLALARMPGHAAIMLTMLCIQIAIDNMDYIKSSAMMVPSTQVRLSTHIPQLQKQYEVMEAFPEKNIPIVLLDNLEFATTLYYAPEKLASRMIYLMRGNPDRLGLIYRRLATCCNARGTTSYADGMAASAPRFLIYGPVRSSYRLNDLLDLGFKVTIISTTGGHFLGIVDRPAPLERPLYLK